MEASVARMAKRSGHAVSVGQDARRERPAMGHWQPRALRTGRFSSEEDDRPGGKAAFRRGGVGCYPPRP
jgi:hypothetical protein